MPLGIFDWLRLWWRKHISPTTEERRHETPTGPDSARSEPTRTTALPATPSRTIPSDPTLQPPTPSASSDFLPISRDELAEQAKNVIRGGVWFGRRDLIPPADDPRTKLIDRALVTHGLLSPEQLVEIHQIGAEMDHITRREEAIAHQAAATAAEAVEADRARRAEIKRQKKEESARRKAERAAAVAHRKANDIIFVGRGVSSRLGDRTSDTARLQSAGLPVLNSPLELAGALGLTISQLRWLCFHTDTATRIHYVQFTVPKRSGGTRVLSAPHRKLATAQRWVLEQIVARLPVDAATHGFVPSRSIVSNAQCHVGQGFVLNMDLEEFFPSVSFARVRSVFQRLGYSGAVATLLALLCTECPRRTVEYAGQRYYVATGPRGLPQGACTSPGLSNQVARRLDRRLGGLATKLSLAYSRYADDLTLSGPAERAPDVARLIARVRHIVQDEGFAVNLKKTRVKRRNAAQTVTGLVVNDSPGVERREIRRLRAILHRARREGLDAQNRDGRENFRAWLQGKIAYVRMSRPTVGERLLNEYQALATN